MKKIKNYSLVFLPLCFLMSLLYYGSASAGYLNINNSVAAKLSIALCTIFVIGTVIILPGLRKGQEKFTMYFLALTTFQMLMAFFVIGILAFQKMDGIKTIGLSFISFFCILLFLQSMFLIIVNRSKN